MMSNELIELKQELMISQQKAEILELKYKLQKTQAEKTSRLEDSLLSPSLYEHYQKVAVMLSKSGVIPNIYKGNPEDIFVAMAMGYQLGFPIEQSLQDIAVVNGRPCLWGDGLLSLALNHPDCESIDEEPIIDSKGNVVGYRCIVTRKGHAPHMKQFTLQDAQMAGLLSKGSAWKSYPQRMLQMRARSFAIRDKFADALRGLRIAEIENEDSKIIDVEVEETVVGKTQVDKLKAVLKGATNDQIEDDIDGSIVSESNDNRGDLAQHRGCLDEHGYDIEDARSSILEKIAILLVEKEFPPERVGKALNYYKVDSLDELTTQQAESFLLQLEKV